jgi:hypothetical protein
MAILAGESQLDSQRLPQKLPFAFLPGYPILLDGPRESFPPESFSFLVGEVGAEGVGGSWGGGLGAGHFRRFLEVREEVLSLQQDEQLVAAAALPQEKLACLFAPGCGGDPEEGSIGGGGGVLVGGAFLHEDGVFVGVRVRGGVGEGGLGPQFADGDAARLHRTINNIMLYSGSPNCRK